MNDRLSALTRAGVSIWLDDLSRERLSSGSLPDVRAACDVLHPVHAATEELDGRVSIEVDARLDEIGTPQAAELCGKGAIANARLAYRAYEQMVADERWQALAAAGARPQRPLWASTSVKDPAYPDTRYVVDLVAPDVVHTMPEGTLRAVADHADVTADSIHGTYEEAHEVLERLAGLGVDYQDVVSQLETDRISTFDAKWRELTGQLEDLLRTTATGQ